MSKLIRISESEDWIIDYDKERGMYRVSYFEDNHFVDEHWFDAYEDKETKEFPMNIKRYEKVKEDAWWCGQCPNCGQGLEFKGVADEGNRKQYCWKCGQLVDFDLSP